MITINYEDYKNLSSTEKMKKLSSIWNLENYLLKGRIKFLNKSRKFFFIEDVTDLNGNLIDNPFDGKNISKLFCAIDADSILYDQLKVGDRVVFKMELQSQNYSDNDKNHEKRVPIIAKKDSVKSLLDIEEVLYQLGIENSKSNIISLIKEQYPKEVVLSSNGLSKLLTEKNIELDADITQRKQDINQLDKEIENKQESLDALYKLSERYKYLGFETFSSKDKGQELVQARIDIIDKTEQIEYIQKYLGSRQEKPLYYEKSIIEKLFMSFHTNQITILSGEPGTGKTSLVEGFADAISAELRMIAVQPNWTDNQDLLGFYNPIEKTYVSTPFLDAITEAIQYPDKLFIICLDEMNLAHVEYYFSEFLSKLQTKNRILNLYSDYVYERMGEELHGKIRRYVDKDIKFDIKDTEKTDSIILSLDKKEDEERFKLIWQWEMFKRYKSSIKIPFNIRFVGTVNKDETTKNLSPKVVDRSFIIELNGSTKQVEEYMLENIEEYETKYSQKLILSPEDFLINRSDLDLSTQGKIEIIKDILKKLNVYLNNRFDDQVKQIVGSEVLSDKDKLFDYIVSSMVLPKININIEQRDNEWVNRLEKQLQQSDISKDIFSNMKDYCENEHILTFWR